MSGSADFVIGTDVTCSDGACGELRRVVIDPVDRRVTHLVVEPRHRHDKGHLVPVDLVTSAEGEIKLRCTRSDFKALEPAEDTRFIGGASGEWPYRQDQMLSQPYFSLGSLRTGAVLVPPGMDGLPWGNPHVRLVKFDRVPLDEVEVQRGEHVEATDGPVGRVEGLVIDPDDHQVTHVLLGAGHLWRQRTVAVPIGAVERVSDRITLSLTQDEVTDLPEADVDLHPLASHTHRPHAVGG